MGKANRTRRRAKLKDREAGRRRRERRSGLGAQRSAGGWHAAGAQSGSHGGRRSAEELAEQLVTDAVQAQFCQDSGALGRCAAQLADRPGVTGWQRIVGRTLLISLQDAVTAGWHQGWQPAEVVRQVSRQSGARHARMAADAVAAQLRCYASATVDERWQAQLAGLNATAWWDGDDGYLEQWRGREQIDWQTAVVSALEVLFAWSRPDRDAMPTGARAPGRSGSRS